MEYIIEMRGISHQFDIPLYNNVDLCLQEKQSVAILGASGSGKSTILNHLSTLLRPQSGFINLAGYKDIYSLSEDDLLYLRQKILGIIFQTHYLFRGFNVAQNLQIAELIANTKYDMQMLEDFGIAHTLQQHIGELSGGQQQRLSIARILTKKPKILLADEPTGNLDKETALTIIHYLLGYVEKHSAALVLATHDEEIAYLCTSVYLLKERQLLQIK